MADRSPSSDPGLLLLISLSGGPKHGHAMLLDVASFAGVRLGPGTLYTAITRMVEKKLIAPQMSSGRQRPYKLTAEGATREISEELEQELRALVDEVLEMEESQPREPISS